jgi:CRP/FNR family transcriptional regulator
MAVDQADAELISKMLHRWSGWERVPDDIVKGLCDIAETIEVKRKRSVFRRGETGPGLFLVKSGEF